MSHDLLRFGRIGGGVGGSGLVVDLHSIVTTLGSLALDLLLQFVIALVLEVDTALVVRLFFSGLRLTVLLHTAHLGITIGVGGGGSSGTGLTCSIGGGGGALSCLLLGLILELVSAVLVLVGLEIGLRLLRWELSGSGSLRIPGMSGQYEAIWTGWDDTGVCGGKKHTT